MPEKIQLDLEKVAEVASKAKNQTEAAEMLGIKYGTFVGKMNADPDVKAAWASGRARREGNENPERSEEVQLDPTSKKVLEEVKDYDGVSLGDLEIALRPMAESVISRSLGVLQYNNLVQVIDGKFFAVDEPAAHPDSRGTRAQKRAKKSQQRIDKSKTNGGGGDKASRLLVEPAAALLPTSGHPLTGHTSEIVSTLEMARVELLYRRVHGESSPKAADVLDRIESGLESLVESKAQASA